MRRDIDVRGRVYIGEYGTIAAGGVPRPIDPRMRGPLDAWCAYQPADGFERLQELHHPGGTPHSREVVELCTRLTMAGAESDLTLVYLHRGHHRQCKTPLLQMLLSMLPAGLRAQGLRVEDARLPLDAVLLAVAALRECGRCLIVKDNAIRLGPPDAVTPSDVRYLLLSQAAGGWAVEKITILDEDAGSDACPPLLSLDEFLADDRPRPKSLSLASRTTTNRLGIMDVVQV